MGDVELEYEKSKQQDGEKMTGVVPLNGTKSQEPQPHNDPPKELEEPLIELLEKRKERARPQIFEHLNLMWTIGVVHSQTMQFSKVKDIVVDQVYRQDKDLELIYATVSLFSFYDRDAIEFVQTLLNEMPEAPKVDPARTTPITNPLGLTIQTHENHLLSLIDVIQKMLKISARQEGKQSVISHKSYITLVHSLLARVSAGDQFWELVSLITRILLVYKFSECSEYLLESFNATKDVSSLYVISRVFFDQAATLVERHQILKSLQVTDESQNQVAIWGLLATISLSPAGKKQVEEFGSVEQLCRDLDQKGQADAHLYKLSLISRLTSTKETADGQLKKVYSDAHQFMLEQISIEKQP